jgi:hypothetical protein
MKNSVVELVEKELAAFRELQLAHPSLFPDNNRLYPIPFFGDIRRAEVITLALNPAHTEFAPARRWPIGDGAGSLTPMGLTNRLLSYFHMARIPPHDWFNACESGLLALECSYRTNAAHIDIHPLPTKFSLEMQQTYPEGNSILGKIIQATGIARMISVLALCERAKLIIVIKYSLPGLANATTFEFVRDRLSPLAGVVDPAGYEPPLIDAGGCDGMADYLQQHKNRLLGFLQTAPNLIFSP